MALFLMIAVSTGLIVLHRVIYRAQWQRGLTVDFKLVRDTVTAGEPPRATLSVSNRKWLPLPWLFVSFSGYQSQLEHSLFAVGAYQQITRELSLTPRERGVHRIDTLKLRGANWLHSHVHDAWQSTSAELIVLPKQLPMTPQLQLSLNSIETSLRTTRLGYPDPFTFAGIRDYQPTDPLKTVNFRASAVMGSLMVNQYLPTTVEKLCLVLTLPKVHNPNDKLIKEEAISLCATLANYYLAQGVQVGLVTNAQGSYSRGAICLEPRDDSQQLHRLLVALAHINYINNWAVDMKQLANHLTHTDTCYLSLTIAEGHLTTCLNNAVISPLI